VKTAEALHDKKIAEIADRIFERREDVRVVLIAGPSSSGKTTFTKKLAIQLRVLGFNPLTISLDDYFLPREQTPRDEEGNYDFEALEAIDVPLLNDHLIKLFEGKEVEIPLFDFIAGGRKKTGYRLQLKKRNILLMEGIHGLNDRLTHLIPAEQKYKIYVSALTQLNLDDHNRIPTTDNRLLRRIVRDHQFRGHSALTTLGMWQSVRRGENRNIFPFRTTPTPPSLSLDYELSVLKTYAAPLLKSVKPFTPNTRRRSGSSLPQQFPAPAAKVVPDDSYLREFIGTAFSRTEPRTSRRPPKSRFRLAPPLINASSRTPRRWFLTFWVRTSPP
jgi:uridine kinase